MSKQLHQAPPKDLTANQFTLSASAAKEFGRLLAKLNSFENFTYISIRDSKINQPLTGTGVFVETDITNLIGPGRNAGFMLSKTSLAKVKKLLSSSQTSISHDRDANAYWFRTGHKTEKLTTIEDVGDAMPCAPVFTEDQYLGAPVVVADILDLQEYIGKASFAWLLVYSGQLEQILTHDREAPYTLKKDGAGSLTGKKPDQVFTCRSFLTIAEKNTKLKLARNDKGMWLVTETKLNSKSGMMKIYQLLTDNS